MAYWEVLGPDPARAQEDFERVTQTVNAFRARQRGGGMVVGVTPHTPHTVSAELLVRITRWAKAEGIPVAIHVAESPAEARLHRHGDGELAETLRAVGVPFESRGVSPVAYLERIGVLATAPTLIHMVEVDEDDVRSVQRNGGGRARGRSARRQGQPAGAGQGGGEGRLQGARHATTARHPRRRSRRALRLGTVFLTVEHAT